jgi:hypothetical protein
MALKLSLGIAALIAAVAVPLARSEDKPAPPAPPPAADTSPKAERLFSFEMIRCPVGEPYLQLSMQTRMSARPDAKAFFTAPQMATVIAKNVTLEQALRMVGDATNTHFEDRGGVKVLQPGAPPSTAVAAKPFVPGPEADPILQGRITLSYGFSRSTLIDVVVRLLHANVVVDPAVMSSGDCNLALAVTNGSFDEVLAQLGARAELRGDVVYILPLAATTDQPKERKPDF